RSYLASWVRRKLINPAVNYHKKNVRHRHLEREDLSLTPITGPCAVDELRYLEMILLIQALPLAYRTVFNLYVIGGFSHEEIANMLHISIGTSKSNLSRARAHLKTRLVQQIKEGATRHER